MPLYLRITRWVLIITLCFVPFAMVISQYDFIRAGMWQYMFTTASLAEWWSISPDLLVVVEGSFALIGLAQLFRTPAPHLPRALYVPMILVVTRQASVFFWLALRTTSDAYLRAYDVSLFVAQLPNFLLAVAAILYHLPGPHLPVHASMRPVARPFRSLHALVDLAVIAILSSGLNPAPFFHWRLPFFFVFNTHPVLYYIVLFGLFYFVQELIFLRTIGKLLTGSFVHCNGSRAKSILVRTFFRFIPFDALSFLGKKPGWHDAASHTEVLVARCVDPHAC